MRLKQLASDNWIALEYIRARGDFGNYPLGTLSVAGFPHRRRRNCIANESAISLSTMWVV
jgi:hypothetical protein